MNSPLIRTLARSSSAAASRACSAAGWIRQLLISIAGIAYFYLWNNHTLSAIFGRNLMSPKALSERLSHITEVVLGYVLKD